MVIARLALLILSLFVCSDLAYSQIPGMTPTPTPTPGSRAAVMPAAARDRGGFDRLDAVGNTTDKPRTPSHPMLDGKGSIYRKPTKDEMKVLAISDSLLSEYASFLQQPDTGIVKLNADSSCVSTTDRIVIATEQCSRFSMPGAGAAFSFRTESYRLPRLADLILYNETFRADAVLQHVSMVELGDVALAEASLNSRPIQYLLNVKPITDGNAFLKYDAELAKGISADGYLYRKGHPVKLNSTFALRSIAYRGKYLRTVDRITYDELEFDRRRDVTVVFRVVEKDEAGNLTIVWKRLKDVESPKLKIE